MPAAPSPATVVRHPTVDRILDEAEALFAHRGYAGTGLSELAERVGVSKSSLFHHFPSKLEIYGAVLERLFDRLWQAVQGRVDAGAPPRERMEQLVDLFIDFLAETPHVCTLLLRGLVEDHFGDAGAQGQELAQRHSAPMTNVIVFARTALKQGIDEGTFRRHSTSHFMQTLIGAILFHFASREFGRQMIGGDLYDPAHVERRKREVKDLVWGGILIERPPSP